MAYQYHIDMLIIYIYNYRNSSIIWIQDIISFLSNFTWRRDAIALRYIELHLTLANGEQANHVYTT